MLVQEFIENMSTETDFRSILVIKKYVPIQVKRHVIEEALLNQIIKVKDGLYTFNSIDKYMAFTLAAITLYTDLEFDNVDEDYDSLMETGYLTVILEAIGEDYFNFSDLFEMRFSDIMRETNTIEAIINSGIQEAMLSLNVTLEKIGQKVDSVDAKTVTKVLDTITKKINAITNK